jgi:hypothetical protein
MAMRVFRSAAPLVIGLALAQLGWLGCSRHSFSDFPTDGTDASSDDSSTPSTEGVLGDDAAEEDALPFIEAGGGGSTGDECAVPPGTYTVTATPLSDSGPLCTGSTSTLTFPFLFSDAGPLCTFAPSGSLPVCAINFSCTADDGTETTNTSGFIEVIDSAFAGSETVVVTFDADAGDTPISTCNLNLAYQSQ